MDRGLFAVMASVVMMFGAGPAPEPAQHPASGIGDAPAGPAPGDMVSDEQGDPERGKILFYGCKACHRIGAGPPREGPDLAGIFGRVAGTAPGYERYSAALREAGFEWTAARLDAWLRDPNGFLPGNRMRFAGLHRAEDRRDLIAYLEKATSAAK